MGMSAWSHGEGICGSDGEGPIKVKGQDKGPSWLVLREILTGKMASDVGAVGRNTYSPHP